MANMHARTENRLIPQNSLDAEGATRLDDGICEVVNFRRLDAASAGTKPASLTRLDCISRSP